MNVARNQSTDWQTLTATLPGDSKVIHCSLAGPGRHNNNQEYRTETYEWKDRDAGGIAACAEQPHRPAPPRSEHDIF